MSTSATVESAFTAVLILFAAGAAHFILQRGGRRFAVLLARRLGSAEIVGDAGAIWRRTIERILLVPKTVLWIAAAYYATDQVMPLRDAREVVRCIAVDSFTAPLFKMGEMSYSALDLVTLPALLVALWMSVGIVIRLVRMLPFRASRMQSGAQDTLGVLTRVLVTGAGGVVIFRLWGVDLSSLAFLGGALGIGIGFGLQTIANNFVSGIVIGLERPIKPGDYVKVGDLVGTVARIGARCTEIRTVDRISILVPNSTLLEHEVVNWSHGDPVSRLHVPVGLAYDSDVRLVRSVLLEAARSHPEVLAQPRPDVQLRGFGDSTLDFDLLVWTRDPRGQSKLISDLYYRIERALRRHGIEIPFPQRDVELRAPAIERAVAAWSRREFPEAELAAVDAAANGHAGIRDTDDEDDDDGPEAWDDRRLAALADRMRGAGGVGIADRRHFLRTHARCFVGRDAVDWLTAHEQLTRDEAVAVAHRLMERGIIHHVLDEHDFRDELLFYRFRADETVRAQPSRGGV
jgi:potassium-dependent mechanosensitive channel